MTQAIRTMGKLFSISGALLFFLACGGSADPAKHFSIQLENKAIQQNQQVGVALKNKKDIEISDLHYYMDGKGWYPVDISEADKNPSKNDYFFGTLDNNRVEFTIGREGKSDLRTVRKVIVFGCVPL